MNQDGERRQTIGGGLAGSVCSLRTEKCAVHHTEHARIAASCTLCVLVLPLIWSVLYWRSVSGLNVAAALAKASPTHA